MCGMWSHFAELFKLYDSHFLPKFVSAILLNSAPLPLPVQVRRLLHGPARAERAAAVDRGAARRPREAVAAQLARPHALHRQRQQARLHRPQRRLRRQGRQQ